MPPPAGWHALLRILLKASALFVVINIAFALANPLTLIGQISLHNILLPGRERLPYGVSPQSYSLSPNQIEMLFASHIVAAPPAPDEYRLFIFGDSSVWGFLLDNTHTLTGQMNAMGLHTPDGRRIRAYNLGYLMNSVVKDLLLIDYAKRYSPDLILWVVTPESFYPPIQLDPPLVQHSAAQVQALIAQYALPLDPQDPRLAIPDPLARSLIGQRRALADWLRLQAYAFTWAATGVDQVYLPYTPRANDFEADTNWYDYAQNDPFNPQALFLPPLSAGTSLTTGSPLWIVNAPVFIADGRGSELRYNAWYPRWMYDQWRQDFARTSQAQGWTYLDLWDAIPPGEFTDSPVHLTPAGSQQFSQHLAQALRQAGVAAP